MSDKSVSANHNASSLLTSLLMVPAPSPLQPSHKSPIFTDSLTTPNSSQQSRPSTLTMNYMLGSRAQIAITNSLGKINNKFRTSSFSPFSSGGYSGVIHNQSSWSAVETRVWLLVLLVGVALLHGNQVALAYALGEMSELEGWSLSTKSTILVSFYWGYMLTPLLSHHMADVYGGERVQWMAALVWSLCLPLTAFLISYSRMLLLALQFVRGMAQGFHMPALLSIVCRRCSEDSRVFLFSLLLSGSSMGPGLVGVIASLSSTSLNHTSHTRSSHWTSRTWLILFLALPQIGVVWAGLVRYFLNRHGKLHKTHYKLSETKKLVKVNSEGPGRTLAPPRDVAGSGRGRERLKLEVQPLTRPVGGVATFPWKETMRNPAIIVLFLAHFSVSLFLHATMTWLPNYWSSTHPDHVWLWNVLPWVAMATGSVGASWISQWLAFHRKSASFVRGLFTGLSLGGSSVFLVVAAVSSHSHHVIHLTSTVCTCAFYGLSSAGTLVNPLDLAPPAFAGTLFAALETARAVSGIVSVYVTGVSLAWLASPNLALLLFCVMNALALIFYATLGSGKRLQFDNT